MIQVFNPLFDTVIQRNNYNNLRYFNKDKKEIDQLFIQLYMGILRWQILVVGNITLTDAMWYDSIFLKKLIESDMNTGYDSNNIMPFEELCLFIKKNTKILDNNQIYAPIMIRVRPKHIREIFFKEFYFSSITDYKLRDEFLEIGHKLPNLSNQIIFKAYLRTNSFSDDLKLYNRLLKKAYKKTHPKSAHYKDIHEIYKNINLLGRKLLQLNINVLYENGNWPQSDFEPLKKAFTNIKKDFKDKYCSSDNSKTCFQHNKNLQNIWHELKSDRPKRSIIEDNLEKLKEYRNEPLINEFYDIFEDKYNQAVAKMQRLYFLDCRRILERELFQQKLDTNSVVNSVISTLGKMSWCEFQKLYDASPSVKFNSKAKKSFLLGKETGGIEINGTSLYDLIFKGRVSFLKLCGTKRMFTPLKFRNKIICEDEKLNYDHCELFSKCKKSCPNIKYYFHDNFDSETIKAILYPQVLPWKKLLE